MAIKPPNPPSQRSYPQRVTGSQDEVWKAIRDLADRIYQISDSLPPSLFTVFPSTLITTGRIPVVLEDTHVNRLMLYPPANYPLGTLFIETDRTVFYIVKLVSAANAWVYLSGEFSDVQANLPADLGTNDKGFSANVTDYVHKLVWSGTNWGWANGDCQSNWMALFEADPSPTTGWHLYDGTANVPYLKSDGTIGLATLKDLTSAPNLAAYLKAGSPNGGPNAAVAPTITGGGGNTGASATGITNPANTGATAPGAGGNNSASVAVQSGAGTTVAANPHTHTSASHTHTIGAPTDPTHVHTIGAISAAADGEPRNLVRRPWFRQ